MSGFNIEIMGNKTNSKSRKYAKEDFTSVQPVNLLHLRSIGDSRKDKELFGLEMLKKEF